MKNTIKVILFLFAVITFSACSTEPEAINYGKDQCNFCKMNVVDKMHAAQYVTKKGKQFKFDAIECMVNIINKEKNQDDIATLLVADYSHPGSMVDALSATYLISEKIKSPMGANLSGFASKELAQKTQEEFGGELYSWQELITKFSK